MIRQQQLHTQSLDYLKVLLINIRYSQITFMALDLLVSYQVLLLKRQLK